MPLLAEEGNAAPNYHNLYVVHHNVYVVVIAVSRRLQIRKLLAAKDSHSNHRMAQAMPYKAALVRKKIAGVDPAERRTHDTAKIDQSISWFQEVIGR